MQFKRTRIAQRKNSLRRKHESVPAYTMKVARDAKNKIGKRTGAFVVENTLSYKEGR